MQGYAETDGATEELAIVPTLIGLYTYNANFSYFVNWPKCESLFNKL